MTLKTYTSRSNVTVVGLLPNGMSCLVTFRPLVDGGSVFKTTDTDIQTALENHTYYGGLFELTDTESVESPVTDPKVVRYASTPNIPTKTSDLVNDSGFITDAEIGNGTLTIQKNGITIDTFTANSDANKAINIDTFDKEGGTVHGDVKVEGDLTLDIDDPDYDAGVKAEAALDDNLGATLTLRGYADETNYKVLLRNIATPNSDYDASTKKYVDDNVVVPTYHLVELNTDGTVSSKASTLTYASVHANLTDPREADFLDIVWETGQGTEQYTRFYAQCIGISEVNSGVIQFVSIILFNGAQITMIFGLDSQDTLTTLSLLPTPESIINKAQSAVAYYNSQDRYPSTKAVYDEFQRKPDIIYQYESGGTQYTGQRSDLISSPTWYNLTGKDLSPYKRVKIYIGSYKYDPSVGSDSDSAGGIIEVDMSDGSKFGGYFSGGTIVPCCNNNNRTLGVTVIINKDNDVWKFAMQVVSLYGTATDSVSGGYVYRIEGYYD